VRADAGGRVFKLTDKLGDETYYACSYRVGKRWDISDTYDISRVRLASPYVAFVRWDVGSRISEYDLYVVDLRTGTERHAAEFRSEPFSVSSDRIRQFVLSRRGRVAWIRETSGETVATSRRVEAFGPSGATTLDPGPGVDAGSLALTSAGRRLYWTNAGEPRSTQLR
jgi:hypothetical protein